MQARQIVFLLAMGCALIAVGLIPSPLWEFRAAMQRFRDSLVGYPQTPRSLGLRQGQRLPGQAWLAAGGGLLILLGLFLCLAN